MTVRVSGDVFLCIPLGEGDSVVDDVYYDFRVALGRWITRNTFYVSMLCLQSLKSLQFWLFMRLHLLYILLMLSTRF
jgi:hypothetical protein